MYGDSSPQKFACSVASRPLYRFKTYLKRSKIMHGVSFMLASIVCLGRNALEAAVYLVAARQFVGSPNASVRQGFL